MSMNLAGDDAEKKYGILKGALILCGAVLSLYLIVKNKYHTLSFLPPFIRRLAILTVV